MNQVDNLLNGHVVISENFLLTALLFSFSPFLNGFARMGDITVTLANFKQSANILITRSLKFTNMQEENYYGSKCLLKYSYQVLECVSYSFRSGFPYCFTSSWINSRNRGCGCTIKPCSWSSQTGSSVPT